MRKNWKTSLLGLGSIITGVALFFKGNQVEAFTAISSGLGLLFAKDHDVTGQ
jgi:hypothetical protein